jgi:GntR family transcriptional regulator
MASMIGLSTPIEKSNEDLTPVYHKLEKAIKEQIENGRLAVGAKIPPEREIARLNNVSLATARRALQNLVQGGFLHRIQGKGTFVSNTALRREKVRYYPLSNRFQGDISEPSIKLIELKLIPGNPRINRHLKIRANQDLYELRRVLYLKRKPIIYCISFLPAKLCSGLESVKKIYLEKFAFYIFLEQRFGISTIENRELYGATLADKDLSKILNVEEGHPVLEVEMLALTFKEKPYEYRISFCLTDEKKIRRVI